MCFCLFLYDFIWFSYDFVCFLYAFILFLYGFVCFYMILYCFYMTLYDFHMILYGFYMVLEVGPQFSNDPFFLTINVWPDFQRLAGHSDDHRFFPMTRFFDY